MLKVLRIHYLHLIITAHNTLLLIQEVLSNFNAFLRWIKHRVFSHHLRSTSAGRLPFAKFTLNTGLTREVLIHTLKLFFLLDLFCKVLFLTDRRCNDNFALFSCYSTNIFSYFLNLIIEGSLLSEIANFVSIGFLLKIVSFIQCESLPLLSYLLHNL